MERRSVPRVYQSLPALAVGVDADGEKFQIHSELDNYSAGGLYLWLGRRVKQGTRLFISFSPWSSQIDNYSATMCVEVHGVVLRTEPQAEGMYGVAVAIEQERIFSRQEPLRNVC